MTGGPYVGMIQTNFLFQVSEMANVKHLPERLRAVQTWQRDGGVMIIGYEMYRNLSQNSNATNEECNKELKNALVDPGTLEEWPLCSALWLYFSVISSFIVVSFSGPDFVICDEGHILRNESSRISKAMNGIKTQRRLVLTGTPLQNNLVECRSSNKIMLARLKHAAYEVLLLSYFLEALIDTLLICCTFADHCMVNFIKKNLLGSLSEFRNRFINPIQNGQCADSTPRDVRIMKKRAHVLHAVLAGCVQVRRTTATCWVVVVCYVFAFWKLSQFSAF